MLCGPLVLAVRKRLPAGLNMRQVTSVHWDGEAQRTDHRDTASILWILYCCPTGIDQKRRIHRILHRLAKRTWIDEPLEEIHILVFPELLFEQVGVPDGRIDVLSQISLLDFLRAYFRCDRLLLFRAPVDGSSLVLDSHHSVPAQRRNPM